MRFVIKLGGVAIEDKKILHASGKAIADLVADGNQVAVVQPGVTLSELKAVFPGF